MFPRISLLTLTCLGALAAVGVQAQPAVEPQAQPKALPEAAPETGSVKFLNGTFTTTATLASDYIFRGFSQTDEKIAPILSATWLHESGVHVDLFGAPVDFNQDDDANVEIDATLGYTHAFTDKLTADLSLVTYNYPGSDSSRHYDYQEGIGTLSYNWGFAKTTALAAYSPEFFGKTGNSLYAEGAVEFPMPVPVLEGVTGAAAFGRQTAEESLDYNTWRAGVNYTLKGFTFGLTYHDTDVSNGACANLCGARVVVSASRSF